MLDFDVFLAGAPLLGLVWLGSAGVATRGFRRLFEILRDGHPELWAALGEPDAMSDVSSEHAPRVREMVAAGGDYDTPDETLRAQLRWMSRVLLVSRASAMVLAIWTLAVLVEHDPG